MHNSYERERFFSLEWENKQTNSSHHHSYTPFLKETPAEANWSAAGAGFTASSPQELKTIQGKFLKCLKLPQR